MKLFTAFCLSLALFACAAMPVHPGAVNKFDSDTYDVLKAAQVTIDNSRDQIARGVLPASFKPIVNAIETAYNPAIEAYKAWHTASLNGTSTPAQLTKLNADLAVVDAAVKTFRGAK